MMFIATGMDNKYFQLLVTGGLQDKRLREIAATIATDTLHKVAHLEYTYQLRDKTEGDTSLPFMHSLGGRYPKLFNKMINILGSRQAAASMINGKIGKEAPSVGKNQSHLTEICPSEKTRMGSKNIGGEAKNSGKDN